VVVVKLQRLFGREGGRNDLGKKQIIGKIQGGKIGVDPVMSNCQRAEKSFGVAVRQIKENSYFHFHTGSQRLGGLGTLLVDGISAQ
jgi:hypothetical protein